MPCDLKKNFSNLEKKIPQKEGSDFHFKKNFFKMTKKKWVTDQLLIKVGRSCYGSREVVAFSFSASKTTYRHFALLLIANELSSSKKIIEIELTNPKSDIKTIKIEKHEDLSENIHWDIKGFDYSPVLIKNTHPLLEFERRPRLDLNLPTFLLQSKSGLDVGPSEITNETLYGFGSTIATLSLATTLLDAGLKKSPKDELRFDSYEPIASVSFISAEAHFWLPGSIGFES